MSLYDAQRHESLTGAKWSEDRARAAIEKIVADTHDAFSPEGLWPLHPFDRSPERPPDCLKLLYHGAAGFFRPSTSSSAVIGWRMQPRGGIPELRLFANHYGFSVAALLL